MEPVLSELQLEIDDVYSCGGACHGCILKDAERKKRVPDMRGEVADVVFARAKTYVQSLDIDVFHLTLGVGDHFLMPEEYLVSIYRRAANLVLSSKAPADRSGIFISTSLIGNKTRLLKKMNALKSEVDRLGVPLLPLVVFDPEKHAIAHYSKRYVDIIRESREIFGEVDLNINLSKDAISSMSVKELVAFSVDNQFNHVGINWAPTLDNAQHTIDPSGALDQWLLDFAIEADKARLQYSFGPVLRRAIRFLDDKEASELPGIVSTTLRRSLQIDHEGTLLAKFEAIGDLRHCQRFGFKPLGSLIDDEIEDILTTQMPVVLASVMRGHSNPTCQACSNLSVCRTTGFHIYNRVLGLTPMSAGIPKDRCRHAAFDLIEYYRAHPEQE